jgi:uncharacterized protein (DUF1501 family)
MISAAALVKGLDSLFVMNALAQPATNDDYKALVCVFLFGGNDSNNIVIPISNYAAYNQIRGPGVDLAIPLDQLDGTAGSDMTIRPTDGSVYALHPQLGTGPNGGLKGLWDRGNAAAVINVGTLKGIYTKAELLAQAQLRPYQLFSHSDQDAAWQTSDARGPVPSGWGGRLADRLRGSQVFPVITSVSGVRVFNAGQLTRPLIIGPTTALGQVLAINRTTDLPALGQIVGFDQGSGRATLVQASSTITQDALRQRDALAAAGDPTFTTVFPATNLGNQLKQIAKLIKVAPLLPAQGEPPINRQIFFAALGGFDTHNNQGKVGGQQGNLWEQVSEAIAAFYEATVELGVSNKVTTFTMSDFSRTMKPANPGANVGTDHAWGSHQFVVGGAVNGGDFYGAYPLLELGGEEDLDTGSNPRGRWIPKISVDQYGATLGKWYGLQPADLTYAFPNIQAFGVSDLGFMQAPVAPSVSGGNLLRRALRL